MNPTQIKNPFKINDWDIKSFLIIVLSIQLAYLGSVGLDKLDIQILLLRQILGFIYLTFIPGYLLLRIFRIHRLSSAESFVYAIGLSLFFSMFIGFIMNMLYPLLGITDKPISEVPIITTLTLATFLLAILAYLRDKDYNKPDFIDLKDILNPKILFLTLIPFMAIFGTYLVNYYDSNILLIAMIVVITLVCLIVGFTNWINEKYYPYVIWVIAVSLIWHITLISHAIVINDNVGECYVAKSVISNGYWLWDSYVFFTYNSVLSVTILPPVIFYILNVSLTWVYKVILPFIYSFVPLLIYLLSKYISQDNKIAFLSSLLFISTWDFLRIALITKQAIALLFFVLILIILILINLDINNKLKNNNVFKVLLLIFGFTLIISHYALTYLFLGSLIFTLIFLKILASSDKKLFNDLIKFTVIFCILAIGWYLYVAQSVSFEVILDLLATIKGSILEEFLNPYASRGLYLLTKPLPSITIYITKYLYILISLLIFIGYCDTIYKAIKYKLLNNNKNFKNLKILIGFSTFWFVILGASILIPYFSAVDPKRLYQVALIILSVFAVLGGMKVIKFFSTSIFHNDSTNKDSRKYLGFICIIFLMLMLFSGTKLIPELLNDHPTSVAISQEKILKYGHCEDKIKLYLMIIPVENILSGKWIGLHMDNGEIFRADWVQVYPSLTVYGGIHESKVKSIVNGEIENNNKIKLYFNLPTNNNITSFIQLTYPNIRYNLSWTWYNPLQLIIPYNYSIIKPIVISSSKIYDNGGSQILLYKTS